MSGDFASLSPADFEDVCRDLVGRHLGVSFEGFAAGPDGGIDGRHARGGTKTILQAKHYGGSTFPQLLAAMKKERPAVDALDTDRYILATSQSLTPPRKAKLAAAIGPSLKDEADILGATELRRLLRDFPDIEKAHIKLWLSSTAFLERVLHSAAHAFSAITKEEIKAKVRVYAQNPSFAQAQTVLESQHVLIISGPPGVGKTTLAEMLSYAYLGEGWQLIPIRSLDDGFGSIVDGQPQIFLFDDFLGKIALDTQALAAKDSDLARFMRLVRGSPNARFILTTRAHIFEEARRTSEYLADQRLDISRYLLDVGIYTRRIRARILYNHLIIAGTPRDLVRALIESDTVRKIVDHKNYNPRVIEWMTDGDRLRDVEPDAYPKAFVGALDNPSQLWDTAYRKHIPDKCRHLLLTMYFCSEYGVELDVLRVAYEGLHRDMCAKYGVTREPKDFEESIRILEGGFITLRDGRASYVNPSFRDYMSGYVDDIELLCDCATAAQSARWADAVWKTTTRGNFTPDQINRLILSFLSVAGRFLDFPTWKKTKPTSYSVDDISNVERLQLLLAWFDGSADARFADLAIQLAKSPPAPPGWSGFSAWRDGAELVELVSQLRDGNDYPGLPVTDELIEVLEGEIIRLLSWGMSYDELENIFEAVEAAQPTVSDQIHEAAMEAVHREIEHVEQSIDHIDSDSTLSDHARVLEKLAPRAGVTPDALATALSKVEDRKLQIEESTSVEDAPAIAKAPLELDSFDNAALASLFAPLLSNT